MYGGGFATIPAYLADLFGPQMVGAIHGRLLTAWATAGVLGPVLVNYIREFQIARGVPSAQAYDVTMYILAGFLALGFLCNLMVRPVADKYFMTDEELAKEKQLAHDRVIPATEENASRVKSASTSPVLVIAAWAAVGVPLIFGLWNTVQKAVLLFK